jgi:transcriptional regulator with XRE-family HTH domain
MIIVWSWTFRMPRKPSLSRLLRDARVKRGFSVLEVAAMVGVSGPCVYLWEAGRTRPRHANLNALCKVLKLPVRATMALAAG